MTRVSIPALFNVCKQLASQSGALIRHIRQTDQLAVKVKSWAHGVSDLVTAADVQAQQLIVHGLRQHWPDLHVIAEEDDHSILPSPTSKDLQLSKSKAITSLHDVPIQNITVWVDPLDATREFAKGDHLLCVFSLIGISVLGYPVAGVMNQPFFGNAGRTISGIVGGPVEGLHPVVGRHTGTIVTTTASHHSAQNDEAIRLIQPHEVIRVGGAGYKATLVMEKKADVYLYNAGGCKLWDTCASHAIINALGGEMTTADGKDIVYSPEHLPVPSLIASLHDHQRYVNVINTKCS